MVQPQRSIEAVPGQVVLGAMTYRDDSPPLHCSLGVRIDARVPGIQVAIVFGFIIFVVETHFGLVPGVEGSTRLDTLLVRVGGAYFGVQDQAVVKDGIGRGGFFAGKWQFKGSRYRIPRRALAPGCVVS
jgi:hypothetical protein